MLLTEHTDIDLFVASKIGSFKHIKYNTDSSKNSKKCIENLVDIKSLQKDDAVTCMEWGNAEQTEILLGKKNQQIQIYSTTTGLNSTQIADFAPGHIVGLCRSGARLVSAVSSGAVRVWGEGEGEHVDIETGGKLDKMRGCPDDDGVFSTGGEENDLKIWRIGELQPIFSAKNLAHDWLQLRQPVWVSDLYLLAGQGGRLAAVCSRHGYVRLYDTRAQRRPVCNVAFQLAATCMAPSFDERQVLVGFGRGQLHQVDLRVGRPDKGYKGCAGAVASVAPLRARRLIVSASLDRHLRVHSYDTKELLYKQYLTSKLSCVLAQTETSTPLRFASKQIKEEAEEKMEEVKCEDELDDIFEKMETVGEKPRKKRKMEEKMEIKPSTAGSTIIDLTEEERIVNLLRSTEKLKRKREKKKREKKAKSVFHNA